MPLDSRPALHAASSLDAPKATTRRLNTKQLAIATFDARSSAVGTGV